MLMRYKDMWIWNQAPNIYNDFKVRERFEVEMFCIFMSKNSGKTEHTFCKNE